MMRYFSFIASSALACGGSTLSVIGILGESFKTALIGMVLVFTAGVFATLYLGSRAKC